MSFGTNKKAIYKNEFSIILILHRQIPHQMGEEIKRK